MYVIHDIVYNIVNVYTSGYETMSVSTSPGTQSNSEGPSAVSSKTPPPPSRVSLPPLPPLGEHIDPVALIDARIKVQEQLQYCV